MAPVRAGRKAALVDQDLDLRTQADEAADQAEVPIRLFEDDRPGSQLQEVLRLGHGTNAGERGDRKVGGLLDQPVIEVRGEDDLHRPGHGEPYVSRPPHRCGRMNLARVDLGRLPWPILPRPLPPSPLSDATSRRSTGPSSSWWRPESKRPAPRSACVLRGVGRYRTPCRKSG